MFSLDQRPTAFSTSRMAWLTFAALLLLASLSVMAQVPKSPLKQVDNVANYTVKSGVEYTQGAAGPLHADVYIPSQSGPLPGILYIHGGGWINGNHNQMNRLIKTLANEGYVGFTIDYDLDPVHYPASFNQSLAALRFFRAHAAEYHLDPSRIAVAGSSAGGELAALVALDPSDRPVSPQQTLPTAPVQAAVILNGVLDLTALGDSSNMVTGYLGGMCTSLAETCKDASPASHVHAGSPPFFVGHGTADKTVPFSQAEAFTAALRAAKVPVRFFTAEDGPHTYWASEQFYDKNVADIESFLALALHTRKPLTPVSR